MEKNLKKKLKQIKNPNKLINEKSPYLLQHAYNPVNWFPWGNEAFERARRENKPIFLSIGYSTCHWCHVMAHESFEDSEIANLMNQTFVSIKVDREERPDIDKIYMTVCQIMTGSGGWPLTIIMTPDKKPFFAGTYFPKKTQFGRVGMWDLILQIKDLWNTQKKKIFDSADQITSVMKDIMIESPGDKLGEKTLKKCFEELNRKFDDQYGGFSNAPKFPTPINLLFLLRFWNRTGNKDALEMVEKTLLAMRRGGIYDHIGFGFHRYSTDKHWLVPHFEKMLYDNALLAMAYLEAYQATGNHEYSKTAQEIFSYILRDMTSPEDGFYSAEDADSEGEEGKFYVWSLEEIEKIRDKEDAAIATKVFNIERSGNYLDEATKQKKGLNIFHLKDSLANISKELKLNEQELTIRLEKIRLKLFNVRKNRIHPYKDNKILTDWNGLMIVALTKGAQILSEPLYLKAAKKSVNFILSNMRKSDGKLLHRYREGNAKIDAYIDDYAFLIWGLIELYEATFDVFYLKNALDLNKYLIEHFWDNYLGGFYFTSDDGEKLLIRQKEIYDGATPSGNSVAMLNLIRLSYITGDKELEEKAEILSRLFAERVNNNPIAHTFLMVAVDFGIGPSYTLVIAGDSDAKDTHKMLEAIKIHYLPNKTLVYRQTEFESPDIDQYAQFVKYFDKIDGSVAAYICINKTCKPPTTDTRKMLELLNPRWNSN